MSYCDGDDPFEDERRRTGRPVWLGLGFGLASGGLLLGFVFRLL